MEGAALTGRRKNGLGGFPRARALGWCLAAPLAQGRGKAKGRRLRTEVREVELPWRCAAGAEVFLRLFCLFDALFWRLESGSGEVPGTSGARGVFGTSLRVSKCGLGPCYRGVGVVVGMRF